MSPCPCGWQDCEFDVGGCACVSRIDLVVLTHTLICVLFLSAVWLTTQNHSTLVTERSAVPFLPVNPEYSATRNQVNTQHTLNCIHMHVHTESFYKRSERGNCGEKFLELVGSVFLKLAIKSEKLFFFSFLKEPQMPAHSMVFLAFEKENDFSCVSGSVFLFRILALFGHNA